MAEIFYLHRFISLPTIESSEPPIVDDDFLRTIVSITSTRKERTMLIYISPVVLNRLLSILPWLLPLLLSGDTLPFL